MSDTSKLAPMFRALVALEQQVSDAAADADPKDRMRVYPWRPSGQIELPAIWNWIDDGSYEIVDTARADDVLIVTATIGVRPADVAGESLDRLVRLTDHFRDVVDPALNHRPVLPDPDGMPTARAAKRVVTRTGGDNFNGVNVMCMDMLIRVELPKIIGG
jgi:hypothetical protein